MELPSVSSQLFCYGNNIEQVIAVPAHADTQIYQNSTFGSSKSSSGMEPNFEHKSGGMNCHFYEEQLINGSYYDPFQSSTANVFQLQQPGPSSSSSVTTNMQMGQAYSGAGSWEISTSSSVDDKDISHQQSLLLSFGNKISHSTASNKYYNTMTNADTRKRPITTRNGGGSLNKGRMTTKKQRADVILYPEIKQCLDDEANYKQLVMKETIQTQPKPLAAPMRRQSNKFSDKITALQKLVSPYGKTDTASVLQEASVSIALLQHQIQTMLGKMRTSYANRKVHDLHVIISSHQMNCSEKSVDLRDKGFCLVPISLAQKLIEEEETKKK